MTFDEWFDKSLGFSGQETARERVEAALARCVASEGWHAAIEAMEDAVQDYITAHPHLCDGLALHRNGLSAALLCRIEQLKVSTSDDDETADNSPNKG